MWYDLWVRKRNSVLIVVYSSVGLAATWLAACNADPQGSYGGEDAGSSAFAVDAPAALDVATPLLRTDASQADASQPDALRVVDTGGADVAPSDAVVLDVPPVALDVGALDLPGADAPAPLAEALRPQTWQTHLADDILPYWTSTEALGTPVGNFPTYRGMDGSVGAPNERRPRMISRQTFALVIGYLMTGDEALLGHAQAGVDWLLTKARDTARGGFHARLTASGEPAGDDDKTAQDTAYAIMGPALFTFVTRDPVVEAAVLETRDLLFDPTTFWDATDGRMRDALSADLSAEVDLEGDGGWELVAQLDAVTAFLLHAQAAVSSPADQAKLLADLRALGQTIADDFFSDGTFWGVSNALGVYGSKHADFGHALKAFWALHLVDRRLADHPFRPIVAGSAGAQIARAYDAANGRWAKRPTGASSVEYGSDWWIYAEADQLTATLAVQEARLVDRPEMIVGLEQTAGHWLTDYVDRTRPAREVVPGIGRDGGWVWAWTDTDTAKCNEWKSGYHSAEHALVLYLTGHALQGTPATLHFAVEDPASFVARPYVFEGQEVARRVGGTVTVGGRTLTEVEIDFTVTP